MGAGGQRARCATEAPGELGVLGRKLPSQGLHSLVDRIEATQRQRARGSDGAVEAQCAGAENRGESDVVAPGGQGDDVDRAITDDRLDLLDLTCLLPGEWERAEHPGQNRRSRAGHVDHRDRGLLGGIFQSKGRLHGPGVDAPLAGDIVVVGVELPIGIAKPGVDVAWVSISRRVGIPEDNEQVVDDVCFDPLEVDIRCSRPDFELESVGALLQGNVSFASLLRQFAPTNALDLFLAPVDTPLVLVSAALARIEGH